MPRHLLGSLASGSFARGPMPPNGAKRAGFSQKKGASAQEVLASWSCSVRTWLKCQHGRRFSVRGSKQNIRTLCPIRLFGRGSGGATMNSTARGVVLEKRRAFPATIDCSMQEYDTGPSTTNDNGGHYENSKGTAQTAPPFSMNTRE